MTKVSQDKTTWTQYWLNSHLIHVCLAALLIYAGFIGAGILRDRSIAASWVPVQGTIVAARPENCGRYAYVVRAHFHYTVGHAEYAGDERADGTGVCGKLAQIEKLAKDTVGTSAELFVNPSDPAEAVLGRPHITLARYATLSLCLALIVAGVAGLVAQSTAVSRVLARRLDARSGRA